MNELLLRKSLKSSADVEVLMRFSKPGPDSWDSRFIEGSGACWVSAGCPWKISDMKRDARSSKSSFIVRQDLMESRKCGDVGVSGCMVRGSSPHRFAGAASCDLYVQSQKDIKVGG